MRFIKLLSVLFTLIFAVSCTKNEVPVFNTNNKKKITDFTLEGTSIKATVYSKYDSLFVGYNPLYVTLTDTKSNAEIKNANISLLPIMDMMTMKHSCPTEQPAYSAPEKAYSGAAAFIMATMGNMGWTIEITTVISGTTYKNTIPVTVKATQTGIKLIGMTKNQNDAPYYVVLINPQKPDQKVGMNDLEVGIYKKNTMMDYPAVDGMNVTVEPTMPSMGHGSPNNVNPVFTTKDHYKGKVNFTMTGDWRLDFTISGDGSTFANHAIIDVLF